MVHWSVLLLALLAILLAACGGPTGVTPPEPPSGGVEVESDFSINLSGLKPGIVDSYIEGTSTYATQGGVHFLSATATRDRGYSNESTVQLSIQIRGDLQERTYVYGPDVEDGADVAVEITVIDDGFTSYNASISQGSITISRIEHMSVEGGFVISFDDTRSEEIAGFGDFVAVATTLP